MAISKTLCWVAAALALMSGPHPVASSPEAPATESASAGEAAELPVGEVAGLPVASGGAVGEVESEQLPVGEVAGLPVASGGAVGEVESEQLPVEEVAGLPVASGGAVGEVESGVVKEAGAAPAAPQKDAANATEQAKLDLAGLEASAAVNLRGASGWGHGLFGETCCMCSMPFGGKTVLYAAEDYSHLFGGHNALWYCQHQCEWKCHGRGGHFFGCYDEQHLMAMDRMYGHRSDYQILHDGHFGNIC